MARARSKPKLVTATSRASKDVAAAPRVKNTEADCGAPSKGRTWSEVFSRASCAIAHWMGKPVAFLIATALVIVWALTGPLFHYSDTWQLVINTSTTIVTFLMVFLIQNTQNRDTMALQLKLSELILCINEAEDRFAAAEDLTEDELERLHKELRDRADSTLGHLEARRASREKKAS